MDPQFRCGNENRRRLVAAHGVLNGIDYLEVLDQGAEAQGLPRQHFLLVHFLDAVPALTEQNVQLEAPPRAAGVNVVWARPAATVTTSLIRDPDSTATLSAAQRDFFHDLDAAADTLVVLADGTGDFSTYTLRLVTSPTDETPPTDMDQRLSAVEFSFKVECPSDFDCAPEDVCPPTVFEEPAIDYLAKDYASFRRLLLDRLSVVMTWAPPGGGPRCAATPVCSTTGCTTGAMPGPGSTSPRSPARRRSRPGRSSRPGARTRWSSR